MNAPSLVVGAASLTALVVGDSAARLLYVHVLRPRGFRTLAAGSGEEAIALASSARPDVVLLDQSLGSKAAEVAHSLRDDARTCSIPVVFVSGTSPPRGPSRIGDVYLERRSSADDIARALRAVLGIRARG